MGCAIEPRKIDIAGAESFYSLEGNMCGAATRGADALPGSKNTSRAKKDRIGSWEISCPAVVVLCAVPSTADRIGKVRSRSR
jgi:hypothetical protein